MFGVHIGYLHIDTTTGDPKAFETKIRVAAKQQSVGLSMCVRQISAAKVNNRSTGHTELIVATAVPHTTQHPTKQENFELFKNIKLTLRL